MGTEERRLITVCPGLLPEDHDTWKSEAPKALQSALDDFAFWPLSQPERAETPEYAYLGIDPETNLSLQGPITASAFGIEPPTNSQCFHLSLLHLNDDGVLSHPGLPPGSGEVAQIIASLERLQGTDLHFIAGRGHDHCLVEVPVTSEVQTTAPKEAFGTNYRDSLPVGQGDSRLRQLVEDSHEILSSLDLNRLRTDQGSPAVNVVWPWGAGFPLSRSRLPIERGVRATYLSHDLRVIGLANAAGYPSGPLPDAWSDSLLEQMFNKCECLIAAFSPFDHLWLNPGAHLEARLSQLTEIIQTALEAEDPIQTELCLSGARASDWLGGSADQEDASNRPPMLEAISEHPGSGSAPLYRWFRDRLVDPEAPHWPTMLKPPSGRL